LLQVGAFPEEFGAYFEDVDLAFRLNRAGFRIVYEPGSRVLHRVGASHRRDRRLLEQQSRNEELVFWRNLPNRALFRALPTHLAVLAGKAWLRWSDGGLIPWIGGRLRALGELPRLVEHRRGLPRVRCETDLRRWGVATSWLPSLDP
jgi:GT2 family glycosyltransferase